MSALPAITPWGVSIDREECGDGITFHSTASHGGYFVRADLNAKVPAYLRAASFNQQGERGWYEEDCDWAIVALVFPDRFPPEAIAAATKALHYWKPAAFEQFCIEKGLGPIVAQIASVSTLPLRAFGLKEG